MYINVPRYLFRYLRDDEHLLSTLTEPYLWFSDAQSLNDPFDLGNRFEHNTSKESRLWHFKKYLPQSVLDEIDLEEAIDILDEKPEAIQEANEIMHKLYMENVHICCFSFECNIPLMWSHYGDAHKGICMVINPVYFVSDFSMIEVKYYTELPKFDLAENRRKYGQSAVFTYLFDSVMLGSKYKDWEYENEWRLISRTYGKTPFPEKAFVGVVLGSKMNESRKSEIADVLTEKYENLLVVDAALIPENGHVEVPHFKNVKQKVPATGWRLLSDPKDEFRGFD